MGKPTIPRKPAGRRQALQIVAIYLLVGGAWILSARRLIFAGGTDPFHLTRLHTFEGWAFLLSTTIFFYLLICRLLRSVHLREAKEKEALVSDLTVQKRLVEALDQAREHYRLLFEQIDQGVLYLDGDGQILAVNPAAEKILGVPGTELLGRTTIDPDGKALRTDGAPLLSQENPLRIALDTGREVRDFILGLFNPERGEYRWVSVDTVPQTAPGTAKPFQVLATLNDITERRQAEIKVQHLAFFDSLTGLPNRRLLLDRLQQALVQADREGKLVGLAFLDLDHFKTINDTLGHACGDTLLKSVAERLQLCIRKSDTVARLGGDEFVIILNDMEHAEVAAGIARKILDIIGQPFRLADREIFISTSIGIALYPMDSGSGEELLSRADLAMYRAKEMGRNLYQFFAPRMNEEAQQRLTLHNELNRGLRRGEFLLFFQEKVSLETGCVSGVEALLRWHHPERGVLKPVDFLSLAEESGLIIPIGEWTLRNACSQGMDWWRMGLPEFRIAVNLSDRQLRQWDLPGTIRSILAESGLPPARLELEIREESLLEENSPARETLVELRQMGITCSLDDFGTGLSAIGRIRSLPLDRIKIHHSLIHDFGNHENAGLIQGIIDLAHNLRLQVVAEGVETEGQKNFLQNLGCDEIQGFHFRHPVPADELTERLQLDRLRVDGQGHPRCCGQAGSHRNSR